MKYTTKLAVFSPCTHKEYLQGIQDDTIQKFLDFIPSEKYSFDFIFTFNRWKDEDEYEDLKIYEQHPNINSVKIFNLDIPRKQDVYRDIFKGHVKPEPIPPLGGSSGPNISFYNSFKLLLGGQYENFLMIENDSFPIQNFWFDKCFKYCEENDFVIAGSKYKGHQKWHYILDYKDHMNGVALYKNCDKLKTLLLESEKYHKTQINENEWFLNFDIAIDRFRKSKNGADLIKGEDWFKDINLIFNCSDPNDWYIKNEQILEAQKETVIVHQKREEGQSAIEFTDLQINTSNYARKIPIFFHSHRCGGTYVKAWNELLFLFYYKSQGRELSDQLGFSRLKRIIIDAGNDQEIETFCYINDDIEYINDFFTTDTEIYTEYFKKHNSENDEYIKKLELEDFINLLASVSIEVFSMIINLNGTKFGRRDCIRNCQEICEKSLASPFFYTSFRNSFQKLESVHKETSYGMCNQSTFKEFANSHEVPDSWLIRSLASVENPHEIEWPHYLEAERILKSFLVKDISELDELISEVFKTCYSLDVKSCKNKPPSSSKKSSKVDLFSSPKTLKSQLYKKDSKINLYQILEGRMFFEQKLFNNIILDKNS
ncbi:MAG: hypothetical protein EBY39_07360 [Flavobacteriia bacterium]|nr:hypothetical protein [Flavobacteriia bacterium]